MIRLARGISILAALFLLPISQADGRNDGAPPPLLDRSAFLSVTVVPLFHRTGLNDSILQQNLASVLESEGSVFAMNLAEGLLKKAFRSKPHVLGRETPPQPNYPDAIANPDSFTIRINITSSYGLSDKGPIGTCLSTAGCLFFAPFKLFSYESRSRASVISLYTSPTGEDILIGKEIYETSTNVRGNFFDIMSSRREIEWVEELNAKTLETLLVKILTDYPEKLRHASWDKAGEYLSVDPLPLNFIPLCRLSSPEENEPALPPSTPEQFKDVVRMAEPSTFEVRGEKGRGSGFVISERGYGLTSLHSVEGSETIRVRFQNGRVIDAKVAFESPALDLAVLALAEGNLPSLSIEKTGPVEKDESLVAIGYIDKIGLTAVKSRVFDKPAGKDALLLTPPLPSEFSGCPLLNLNGKVIGIHTVPPLKGEAVTILFVENVRKIVEPFMPIF